MIRIADCYLLEKDWGDGKVMFGNKDGTGTDIRLSPDGQNLRQNIIDYMKLCTRLTSV